MSIRSAALQWIARTHPFKGGKILTSRFYPPKESWTGTDAWWINLPLTAVEQGATCTSSANSQGQRLSGISASRPLSYAAISTGLPHPRHAHQPLLVGGAEGPIY